MASFAQKFFQKIRIRNNLIRECLAEFLGTFILIVLGDGCVAQVVLSDKLGTPTGTFISINFGYGFAVAFGVYVAGGVSGGHINPAVSLAMCTVGKLPWRKLAFYMLSQYVGAILGSAVVYGVYLDALNAADPNRTTPDTAGIWATYPQDYLTAGGAFLDQVVGTALLLLLVLAVTDDRNIAPPKGIIPLVVGFIVMSIGFSFGFNAGYAINPARDLGPRIFTAMAGWGSDPFTIRDHYFWIPILGPHLGAILGTWLYMVSVGAHTEDPEEKEEEQLSLEKVGAPPEQTNGAYTESSEKF